MSQPKDTLHIIYGSRTGNTKAVAVLAKEYAEYQEISCSLHSMDEFEFNELKNIKNLLVLVSTHGEGEPPVPAEDFHAFVHSEEAPEMKDIQYAVLGLGDSSYRYFCQTGLDFDLQFEKLGANRLIEVEKCDIDFEEKSKQWVKKVIDKFAGELISQQKKTEKKQFVFELKLDDNQQFNAYKAAVLNKTVLNGENASHPTLNITFSLKDSGIDFHPGDLVGVYVTNSRLLVDKLIKYLKLDRAQSIGEEGKKKMLKDTLINDYELTVLTPIVLKKYAELINNTELDKLLADEELLNEYSENNDILDMVTDFKGQFEIEDFLKILRKLSPRLYSAASYRKGEQDTVDLTIRNINYQHKDRTHQGVCSSYVWTRLEQGDKAPVFIEKNGRFRLPENHNTPVIMISTGTGIAPFRSFLQYRNINNATGKNWLFFGERNSTTDFFYKDEIMEYKEKGLLTELDTAFSRDSEKKHYIYHSLLEKGPEVYQWIQKGAHIYICGNKRTMANDVRNALSDIVMKNGNMSAIDANNFLKDLKTEKRLQEDVY